MPTSQTEVIVISAIVLAAAGLIQGTQIWLHRRRRLSFRDAATRAGLDPGDGDWVEAKCAATVIRGRELYTRHSRRDPEKDTLIEAELPGKFPEAFHASTDEHAIGLVRATFPTRSGKHTVYVRGLVEADTLAFLTGDVREALAEGLDLAPQAFIEPNKLLIRERRWFPAEVIRSMFAGLARICRTLAPEPAGYRRP